MGRWRHAIGVLSIALCPALLAAEEVTVADVTAHEAATPPVFGLQLETSSSGWRAASASSPGPIISTAPEPVTHQTFDRSIVAESVASPVLPSPAGPPAWHWQALPDGLLYRSYLAGPKEPRLSGAWLYESGENWVWDGTLGGRVGIVRFGTSGAANPEGWQLDLEAAAFPRLDEDQELISSDFRVGVPLTWAQGPWEFKFGYYHISAHVGDEYLEAHPGFTRVNYVRDSLVLGTAYWLSRDVRVYGEVAYAFGTSGGAQPWEFQFGGEYVPEIPTGRWLMPFAAANVNLREEFDYGGNVNVMAGWRWRSANSGRLLRFGLQYFNGKSSQYAFFDDHEELFGAGFWFDY